jgi:tRNA modification GTPase trmE
MAIDTVEKGFTLDAVTVFIDDALNAIFELTGERASDSVIDRVFSKFCIGK